MAGFPLFKREEKGPLSPDFYKLLLGFSALILVSFLILAFSHNV
jgi:hypothetical protein